MYWLWPSSTWGQSSMDDACNTRSMSYRFQFQVQGTGVKRAPVFNPQVLKMATRTSTSYCSLPEGNSEFRDGIHSTNDSWNILLQFHHSGLIPIARSSSSPEQQVDNSRATTAGAVSRSTREGTTNCVMTASLRAFDGGLCDGVGPSCHGLVINLLGFLITLLDAAQTWCS